MKTLDEIQDEQTEKRIRGHRARMLKFAELVQSGTAAAVSPKSLEQALQEAASSEVAETK